MNRDSWLAVAAIALFVVLASAKFGLDWWSCGKRFPNAQFACFITGK